MLVWIKAPNWTDYFLRWNGCCKKEESYRRRSTSSRERKSLSDVLSNVKTFEMKLKFIKKPIKHRNLIHLPSCKSAFGTYVKKWVNKGKFSDIIHLLQNELSPRLNDFYSHFSEPNLFQNPLKVGISKVVSELQVEVDELQHKSIQCKMCSNLQTCVRILFSGLSSEVLP